MHPASNNFYYDNKFSFEFDQLVDLNNRLVISVWSVQHSHALIGCFSFKIKHLLNSTRIANSKAAWYHLLPLKYGMSKHLVSKSEMKATSRQIKHQPGIQHTESVTNLNKDLIGMRKIGLSVIRANEHESFGFTVTNSCPCMVGKVDLNKNAFNSGLRPGDYIACINGQNVSRATCETVVKLIKACKQTLNVEVFREEILQSRGEHISNTTSGEIDFIANKLLNSHLQYQQKLASKNYGVNVADDFFYQDVQQPVESTAKPQSQHLVNQFGLEVVLEEEEEDMISDVEDCDEECDDENGDYQEIGARENGHHVMMQVDSAAEYTGFVHAQHKFRYVDSSSDPNSTNDEEILTGNNDDYFYEQKEAEVLRRAAQQFYSSSNEALAKKANVLSLRNLKIDEQQSAQNFNSNYY